MGLISLCARQASFSVGTAHFGAMSLIFSDGCLSSIHKNHPQEPTTAKRRMKGPRRRSPLLTMKSGRGHAAAAIYTLPRRQQQFEPHGGSGR
jgi:hypothetical protein